LNKTNRGGTLVTSGGKAGLGPSSTELAKERTYLAAERTLFAALRTGLSIAGGGSLVVTLLGDEWPRWVQVPLVVTFLGTGYWMALLGLQRYRGALASLEREAGLGHRGLPLRFLTAALLALQLAIVVVVVLFLVGAFEGAGS
jgi:uncharacterized membrane protein YidH (DUF202 family)